MVRLIAAARRGVGSNQHRVWQVQLNGTLHDRKIAVAARMTIDEAGPYPIVRG
jgi:hypothetical protein